MASIVNESICMMVIVVVLAVAGAPQIEADPRDGGSAPLLYPEAAISCGTVFGYVQPCLPYVTNQGPIGRCCNGVKGLNDAAKTKADRQSACVCLKTLASSSSIDLGKVAGLPAKCGVHISYSFSPSTDCSKVS